MKYDFTQQEVIALKELINIAVKSVGMKAASAGVALTDKLDRPTLDKPVKEEPK